MLRLMSDGDSKYRLENSAGTVVGWIRGQVIGLTGFASVADAIALVPALNHKLEIALTRKARRSPPALDPGTLHLADDGAYEWTADGARAIARVYPPGIGGTPNNSVSIEFVLPASVKEAAITRAALAIVEQGRAPRESRGEHHNPGL
jgi:hypothetical protein